MFQFAILWTPKFKELTGFFKYVASDVFLFNIAMIFPNSDDVLMLLPGYHVQAQYCTDFPWTTMTVFVLEKEQCLIFWRPVYISYF